jgi:hypothetical protein
MAGSDGMGFNVKGGKLRGFHETHGSWRAKEPLRWIWQRPTPTEHGNQFAIWLFKVAKKIYTL